MISFANESRGIIVWQVPAWVACTMCWLMTHGCNEGAKPPSHIFFEPDLNVHGSLADLLPPCNSIAEMSVSYSASPAIGIPSSNELAPWHPAENDRCSILRLFKETRGIKLKNVGEAVGRIKVADQNGKEFEILVVMFPEAVGEAYGVVESADRKSVWYAPVGGNKKQMIELFKSKSNAG
jgi:hypothetical protein